MERKPLSNIYLQSPLPLPVFLLIGSVVSVLLAFMIQFLLYPLDYSRIETIQFDDDHGSIMY